MEWIHDARLMSNTPFLLTIEQPQWYSSSSWLFVNLTSARSCCIADIHLSGLTPAWPTHLSTAMLFYLHVMFAFGAQPIYYPCFSTRKNETDTTWPSFSYAIRVASALHAYAIRFSFLLSTASTVITNKMGPCYSTGQPDPFGGLHTRAPIGLYTEVLELSSRVPRTEEVAVRREGFSGSEPVFHGDNNIYHHRGCKEGR